MHQGSNEQRRDVVECSVDLQRGRFYLRIHCRLASAWTVIFGPSGSGKTTFLRAIAGLERNAGRITLNSREIGTLKAGTRRVGMVTQQPALFPHLSVKNNVSYGLPWMGEDERIEVTHNVLALVEADGL